MRVHSAGLLPFRQRVHGGAPSLEVLLVHPGGPFWARKDLGAWSVAKGELDDPGETDPRAAAAREFAEELGVAAPPQGDWIELGEVRQRGGKRVRAWAVEADVDVTTVRSNTFELEWPPRTGVVRTFPEVDRAAWFDVPEARRRLLAAQVPFLDRLLAALGEGAPRTGAPAEAPPDG